MRQGKEAEIFARVAGVPGFRQYLLDQYDRTCSTMVNTSDEVQLRRAQGDAQRLSNLVKLIDTYGRQAR